MFVEALGVFVASGFFHLIEVSCESTDIIARNTERLSSSQSCVVIAATLGGGALAYERWAEWRAKSFKH